MSGSDGAVFQTLDHAQLLHGRMATRYTGDERERLQAHEAAIGDLRASLMTGGGTCEAPDLAGEYGTFDPEANENVPVITRMQIDVMVAAMACNLTRVGTFVYQQGNDWKVPTWLGVSAKHHTLTHETTAVPHLVDFYQDTCAQFVYLLQKLDSIPEGDGTMLDNTFVLWGNELGDGRYHRPENIPYVLAGGAGGYFETGRFIDAGGQDHSRLLVSILHAMGLTDIESFGMSGLQTGPLLGL